MPASSRSGRYSFANTVANAVSPSNNSSAIRFCGSCRSQIQPLMPVQSAKSILLCSAVALSGSPSISPTRQGIAGATPSALPSRPTGSLSGTGSASAGSSTGSATYPSVADAGRRGAAGSGKALARRRRQSPSSMMTGDPGTSAPVSAQRRCRTLRAEGSTPSLKGTAKACRPSPMPACRRSDRYWFAITFASRVSPSTSSSAIRLSGCSRVPYPARDAATACLVDVTLQRLSGRGCPILPIADARLRHHRRRKGCARARESRIFTILGHRRAAADC